MVSLVTTRKRKGIEKPLLASQDKGKVRVVEQSAERHNADKVPHARTTTPASRTLTNFRRGSVKIFSIFRGGKGMFESCHSLETITLLCSHMIMPLAG